MKNDATYKEVEFPPNRKIVGNKWEFKVKEDSECKKKCKARLVAK